MTKLFSCSQCPLPRLWCPDHYHIHNDQIIFLITMAESLSYSEICPDNDLDPDVRTIVLIIIPLFVFIEPIMWFMEYWYKGFGWGWVLQSSVLRGTTCIFSRIWFCCHWVDHYAWIVVLIPDYYLEHNAQNNA